MSTAFEAITTRQSWFAGEAVSMYDAVEFSAAGKFVKADGTGQFAGIVQYGAEVADEMATVVKGIFPVVASEDVTAGDNLTIDATAAGTFKVAGIDDVVYGKALTAAVEGKLFSMAIADVPAPIQTT